MISPSTPVRTVALGRWLEKKVARGEADLEPASEPAPVLAPTPVSPSSPASTNGSLPSSTRSLFFGRTLPDPRGLPIKEHGASDPALHRSPSPSTSASPSAASPATPKAKSRVRYLLPPPKDAHRAESAEHEGMELDEPTASARTVPSTPNATPPKAPKARAVATRQHDVRSTVAVASPLHRVHAHRRSYSVNRPPPLALRPSNTVHLLPSPTQRWTFSPTRPSHHRGQPSQYRTCAPVPRTPLPLAPVVQEQRLRELNLEQLRIGQWIIPPPPAGYDHVHRPGCAAQGCTHASAAITAPHADAAHDASNANSSRTVQVAGQDLTPYKPLRNSGAWITPRMARHMFFGGIVTAVLPDGTPLTLSMSKEQRDMGLPVAAIAGVPTRSVMGRAMWAEWVQAANEGRRLENFKMTKLRREMEVTMRRGLKLKALPDPSAVSAPSRAPQRSSPAPPATPMVKVEPEL